jgi:hypothetical protein
MGFEKIFSTAHKTRSISVKHQTDKAFRWNNHYFYAKHINF